MNINKLTNGVGGDSSTRDTAKTSSGAKPAADKPASTPPNGEVTLSQQSKSIKQIEAEVAKMPEIDDAAVERIKGALANNEYKIDYERIAGKMIKFDNLLN